MLFCGILPPEIDKAFKQAVKNFYELQIKESHYSKRKDIEEYYHRRAPSTPTLDRLFPVISPPNKKNQRRRALNTTIYLLWRQLQLALITLAKSMQHTISAVISAHVRRTTNPKCPPPRHHP